MTKVNLIIVSTTIALTIMACTKDKLAENALVCETDVVYNDVKSIITGSCAYSGCHNSSDLGNFLTYEGMESYLNSGAFEAEVLESRTMPPDYADGPKTLTQEQIDMLQCWKQNGFSKF